MYKKTLISEYMFSLYHMNCCSVSSVTVESIAGFEQSQ